MHVTNGAKKQGYILFPESVISMMDSMMLVTGNLRRNNIFREWGFIEFSLPITMQSATSPQFLLLSPAKKKNKKPATCIDSGGQPDKSGRKQIPSLPISANTSTQRGMQSRPRAAACMLRDLYRAREHMGKQIHHISAAAPAALR